MNELVRKESIEEICGHRARTLELYQRAWDTMQEGYKAHAAATMVGGMRRAPHIAVDSNDRGYRQGEFMENVTRNVDRDIWQGLVMGTPIGSLMDRQELEAFKKSLEQDPPPATADNVRATLERLFGEADQIFRRGLVNAFKRLDRDYASNDGFKIGDRIVLTWGCTWDRIMGYFTLHHTREEELHDIDRVMHVLDGKPAPDRGQGLEGKMAEHTYGRGRDKGTTGESEYFRFRLFKNGNIHLWPRRQDLLDRANKIIAEHFGMVLAAGRDARESTPSYQPRPGEVLKADFFPTPDAVVAQLVAAADIEDGMKVLEPSAGEGAIVAGLVKAGANVWAYEIDPERRKGLITRFFSQFGAGGCVCADFLEREPEPAFDRVVMNPPFSRQQDIRHVLHALRFLKPGGRLVAVMSGSAENPQGRLGDHFSATLARLGGTIERLPAGSFKESGTGVTTVMVVIDAPAAMQAAA
ncbi:DUF4942 domain-containing protein [Methylobacterium ajmalii]|uniref:DUF4942 domain-containing protein n=1 Tax=Methylobacterium ajmalii TaxID=2738439 RepID=UPI002F35EF1F